MNSSRYSWYPYSHLQFEFRHRPSSPLQLWWGIHQLSHSYASTTQTYHQYFAVSLKCISHLCPIKGHHPTRAKELKDKRGVLGFIVKKTHLQTQSTLDEFWDISPRLRQFLTDRVLGVTMVDLPNSLPLLNEAWMNIPPTLPLSARQSQRWAKHW